MGFRIGKTATDVPSPMVVVWPATHVSVVSIS
jgi:hypothetical protein